MIHDRSILKAVLAALCLLPALALHPLHAEDAKRATLLELMDCYRDWKAEGDEALRAQKLEDVAGYLFSEHAAVSQLAERYLYAVDLSAASQSVRDQLLNYLTDKIGLAKNDILVLDELTDLPAFLAAQEIDLGVLEVNAGRWYNTPVWATMLIDARNGDPDSVEQVLQRIQQEPSMVEVATRVFEDLAYVQQDAAIELLKDHLLSDTRLPATVAGVPGKLVSHHAAYHLSKTLAGFPVQKEDPYYYTDAELEQIENWILLQEQWNYVD